MSDWPLVHHKTPWILEKTILPLGYSVNPTPFKSHLLAHGRQFILAQQYKVLQQRGIVNLS